MGLKELTERYFAKHKPLTPGLVHHRGLRDLQGFRLHLRIEEGGQGILSINASKILHLNPTATELAKHIIEGDDKDRAVKAMKKRYRGVSREQLRNDYQRLKETLFSLAERDDVCPITYLDIDRIEPFTTPVSAPYRFDLALTYGCNVECSHCYVERPKDMKSLSLEEWKKVLDKVWEIGTPHVCFTGGEATLHPNLAELAQYAQEVGLVTGLLTNGRALADKAFLQKLVEGGLDHIQITLESHDEKVHDEMVGEPGAFKETVEGIRNAVANPVYTITNTTISKKNADGIEKTVEFIQGLGVTTFAVNGIIYSGGAKTADIGFREEELSPILERVRKTAEKLKMRLIWYSPTQYCQFNPIENELGVKTCTAAKYNMAIEPNGDVLPCQSYFQVLGNILKDDWKTIWGSELARKFRDRGFLMAKCEKCEHIPLCGGGCPLYNQMAEVCCPDSKSNA